MQIDQLCSRLKTGDQSAFNEVVQLFGEKFKAQVRRMLSKYPGVRRWEETDDVYQTLLIKLHRSLSEVNVSSPAEIFAIASTQIRRTLIDLARHYFGKRGVGRNHFSDDQNLQPDGNPQINQKESPSSEPESIEQWSEFHSAVESLETDQKEVFLPPESSSAKVLAQPKSKSGISQSVLDGYQKETGVNPAEIEALMRRTK